MMAYRRLALIILISFLIPQPVWAQRVVTEIAIDNAVEDIQCYAQGDSVLVTFLEQIPRTTDFFRQSYWIFNDRADTVDLDFLENHVLSGVTHAGGDHFYYYIHEKEKQRELRAITGSRPDTTLVILPSGELKGDILAVINDVNLYVCSFEPRVNQFHIIEVNGKTVVRKTSFEFPYDLSYYYTSSFGVFSRNALPTAAGGSAEFKLYKRGDLFMITIDQNRFGGSTRTDIITLDINEPGKPDIKYIEAPRKNQFRSFLSNNILYRAAITRRHIDFTMFDVVSGHDEGSLRITTSDKSAKEKVTTRLGHLAEISRTEELGTMMATSGNFFPSIVKWDVDQGSDEVMIANYIYSHNTGSGTGGFGLGRMISYHHPATFTQMAEPIGVSKYIHLRRNGNRYELETKTAGSVIDRIDDYEIALSTEKHKTEAKAYINTPTGIVAIYAVPTLGKIAVVSFQK